MKFLIDECLTDQVADRLTGAGHDAVHVRAVGLLGASDREVMAAAAAEGRVVVSGDTDFGELLAKGGMLLPSVILLRRAHLPAGQVEAILAALEEVHDDLVAGAVVVVTSDRIRVRSLPIR